MEGWFEARCIIVIRFNANHAIDHANLGVRYAPSHHPWSITMTLIHHNILTMTIATCRRLPKSLSYIYSSGILPWPTEVRSLLVAGYCGRAI